MSESGEVFLKLIRNKALISDFLVKALLKFNGRCVLQIELIESYLEMCLVLLEHTHERIGMSFSEILRFLKCIFEVIRIFLQNAEVIFDKGLVNRIELIEFYLEHR